MSLKSDADLLGQQIVDVMADIYEMTERQRRVAQQDVAAKSLFDNLRVFLERLTYHGSHSYGLAHREWAFSIEFDGECLRVSIETEGTD